MLRARRRTAMTIAQRSAAAHGSRDHGSALDPNTAPENFIPLRYPDLRDRLVEGHPEFFAWDDEAGAAARIRFYRLAELMSLRNMLRLSRAFRPLLERYAYLDPDVDASLPQLTGSGLSREARAILIQEFEEGVHELLLRGGFEEVSERQLQASMASVGVSQNGLAVRPPDPRAVAYRVYSRGLRDQEVTYRSWRTLYLKRTAWVPVFARLALVFRARSESDAAAMAREDEGGSGLLAGWVPRALLHPFRQRVIKAGRSRDIELSDCDMLLPGSVAKFTWVDQVMVWAPVLFGLVSATVKAARGTLNFDTLSNIFTSCMLVILPAVWAVRAYLAVSARQRDYAAHLNRVYLLHAVDNNGGVLSQILQEAREQEDDEVLLAYFFAWKGQQQPRPIEQRELDAAVESWVNRLVAGGAQRGPSASALAGSGNGQRAQGRGAKPPATPHQRVFVDFQVRDALDSLAAMGLVREPRHGGHAIKSAAEPGAPSPLAVVEALPIEEALAVAGGSSLAALADGAAGAATPRSPDGRDAAAADESSAAYPRVNLSAGPAYFSPVDSAKRAAAELAAARLGSGGASRGTGCGGASMERRLHAPQLAAAVPGWDRGGGNGSGGEALQGRPAFCGRQGAELMPPALSAE
ncbi:hypothetical protein Rsub_11326 [Raphidocelis subcapitata]|uniref:Uncharacterized protein n=1 Tax=Raphidocelis subcapitata TaxID=307507 RepID=A0A2V0PFH2_9CHLO|nr:hypothetical protein Rsub_11326 [Raphidocelis subcapitata]|eukprot:GBF98601.1 hypothetical protein Rsub_11326 [Raphidocelis subcapitata]